MSKWLARTIRSGRLPGIVRDDVDHLDRAERRRALERLFGGLDAERGQLRLDVLARLDVGRRARRPRPDRDLLAQVLPGLRAVEGLRGRLARTRRATEIDTPHQRRTVSAHLPDRYLRLSSGT